MLGRGFPGENSLDAKPKAISRRKHAGSLEALRVTRPEAVDLVGIKIVPFVRFANRPGAEVHGEKWRNCRIFW